MKIIEINEGTKIDYEVRGSKIAFNDDELTLNLERYERDDENHIDICRDKFGCLVSGVIPGLAEAYVAQIDIPARSYTERPVEALEEAAEDAPDNTEGGGTMNRQTVEREPAPFDMAKCTLTLWALA